jgi:hypothetical protein
MTGMSKRPGYHDYLLRLPEESWQEFNELVESLRPRRSVNQQIVHLIEEFVRKSKEKKKAEPT